MSTESHRRPPTIDPVAALRWARRVPAEGSPWLHEEVGRRMEDRLQWIKARPRQWADWSPLRGGLEAHALVAQRYPDAQCWVVEPEPALRPATAQQRCQLSISMMTTVGFRQWCYFMLKTSRISRKP